MEPFEFFTHGWSTCLSAFTIWMVVAALRDYFNGGVDMNLCLYFITAVLWGIFATRMHRKLNRTSSAFLCFALNSIFYPIAIVVAIIKCPIE